MTSLETIEDGLLRIADKIANFETITEENVEPFEALVLEAGTRRHKALILPLLLALDDHC